MNVTDLAPPSDTGACGQVKGYQRHRNRKQEPCVRCKRAHAAYMQDYRANQSTVPSLQRGVKNAARKRAAWRLVAEHPERFQQLYGEECARAGVTP